MGTNRKLASIQLVRGIHPIPGADNIESIQVLDWSVVHKKGECKVGDKIIFLEIDTLLPDKPEFEFMRTRKFRVRTIKLRGTISQGLILPLSLIPLGDKLKEGADVTEALGATKYDPELAKAGVRGEGMPINRGPRWLVVTRGIVNKVTGFINEKILRGVFVIPRWLPAKKKDSFPSFIPKTDEPRVQSVWKYLENYRNQKWIATEKLDGCSVTFYLHKNKFGVCSRNLELKKSSTNGVYWAVAERYGIENKMRHSFLDDFSIQGEILSPRVQKNRYQVKEPVVYFFNVYDIAGRKYLSHRDAVKLIQDMGLNTVPELYIYEALPDVKDLIIEADGKSVLLNTQAREGLVFRPLEEATVPGLGRLSFKVISNKYLLKYEGDE